MILSFYELEKTPRVSRALGALFHEFGDPFVSAQVLKYVPSARGNSVFSVIPAKPGIENPDHGESPGCGFRTRNSDENCG